MYLWGSGIFSHKNFYCDCKMECTMLNMPTVYSILNTQIVHVCTCIYATQYSIRKSNSTCIHATQYSIRKSNSTCMYMYFTCLGWIHVYMALNTQIKLYMYMYMYVSILNTQIKLYMYVHVFHMPWVIHVYMALNTQIKLYIYVHVHVYTCTCLSFFHPFHLKCQNVHICIMYMYCA